jgi:hypothetical protein
MGFDVSKVVREEDADEAMSAAEVARALEPLRQQLREVNRGFSGLGAVERMREQQRRQHAELARNSFASRDYLKLV